MKTSIFVLINGIISYLRDYKDFTFTDGSVNCTKGELPQLAKIKVKASAFIQKLKRLGD